MATARPGRRRSTGTLQRQAAPALAGSRADRYQRRGTRPHLPDTSRQFRDYTAQGFCGCISGATSLRPGVSCAVHAPPCSNTCKYQGHLGRNAAGFRPSNTPEPINCLAGHTLFAADAHTIFHSLHQIVAGIFLPSFWTQLLTSTPSRCFAGLGAFTRHLASSSAGAGLPPGYLGRLLGCPDPGIASKPWDDLDWSTLQTRHGLVHIGWAHPHRSAGSIIAQVLNVLCASNACHRYPKFSVSDMDAACTPALLAHQAALSWMPARRRSAVQGRPGAPVSASQWMHFAPQGVVALVPDCNHPRFQNSPCTMARCSGGVTGPHRR